MAQQCEGCGASSPSGPVPCPVCGHDGAPPEPRDGSVGSRGPRLVGAAVAVVLVVGVVVTAAVLATRAAPPPAAPAAQDESRTPTCGPTNGQLTIGTVPCWGPWQPRDKSFTIDFIGLPGVRSLPADPSIVSEAFLAGVQQDLAVYQLTWFVITDAPVVEDASLLLNDWVDESARKGGYAITSRTMGQFDGYPSLDFEGERRVGSVRARYRGLEVITDRRVFMFLAIDTGDGSAEFERFRDSFRLEG